MGNRQKIVFVHLLNDFSGSPRVLSQVVNEAIHKGIEVDMYTCNQENKGFLSDIAGVNQFHFFYRWSPYKLVTLFFFLFSQFSLFLKLLKYKNENVIFYVNTILPFGAALAGKLLHKKVIYHIHETSIKPAIFKSFLMKIVNKTANEAIYVSNFLLKTERLHKTNCHVVYNALSKEFIKKSIDYKPDVKQSFRVLMLSSLKEYKGIFEFIELANKLNHLQFELVINSTQAEIDTFLKSTYLSKNLTIHPSQENVHPFYQAAHLVINLSHPLKWVETFGMTALEAMSYSIPVIVPPVGGIAEIVEDGVQGYKIDVRHTDKMAAKIDDLASNATEYNQLSENALIKSTQFNPSIMVNSIFSIIYKPSL